MKVIIQEYQPIQIKIILYSVRSKSKISRKKQIQIILYVSDADSDSELLNYMVCKVYYPINVRGFF